MICKLFNFFIDTLIFEKREFLSNNNAIVLTQEAFSEVIFGYTERTISCYKNNLNQ